MNPTALVIEDQREVLDTLLQDLQALPSLKLIPCESASEAEEVLLSMQENGEFPLLLICDHVMPEENGIEFLIRIKSEGLRSSAACILLTGMATHEDTIRAINEVKVTAYIAKPWDHEDLILKIRQALTFRMYELGMTPSAHEDLWDARTLWELSSAS